jgi:hypothetical protein
VNSDQLQADIEVLTYKNFAGAVKLGLESAESKGRFIQKGD